MFNIIRINQSQTGGKGMKSKMLIATLLGCLVWQQGALSQTDTIATNPAATNEVAPANQPAINTDTNQSIGTSTANSPTAPAVTANESPSVTATNEPAGTSAANPPAAPAVTAPELPVRPPAVKPPDVTAPMSPPAPAPPIRRRHPRSALPSLRYDHQQYNHHVLRPPQCKRRHHAAAPPAAPAVSAPSLPLRPPAV